MKAEGTMDNRPGPGPASGGGKGRLPHRGLRRLLALLAAVPLPFFVLLALFALRPGRVSPPWVLATVLLGILATAGVAGLAVRRVSCRLREVEGQRGSFFEELSRLSRVSSLGQVSSSIAHDLNNPLAILNEEAGWLSDLLSGAAGADGPAVRAEMAASVAQIQEQVRRAREISRRILSWARETEGASGRVDLNEAVVKALHLLEGEMVERPVRVQRSLAPGLPPVPGTVAEVRQVILHLAKNALDAMGKEGGTLTLATRASDGKVVLSVGDTGPGIPRENLERIFEPFFTTKPEGQGTGLGLSISLYIVKKLGGTLEVESRPGEGTVFHVVLPAARESGEPDLPGGWHAGRETAPGG